MRRNKFKEKPCLAPINNCEIFVLCTLEVEMWVSPCIVDDSRNSLKISIVGNSNINFQFQSGILEAQLSIVKPQLAMCWKCLAQKVQLGSMDTSTWLLPDQFNVAVAKG